MSQPLHAKADTCGRCGSVLESNRSRTEFECRHCGMSYKLPEAPILARSLRPGPPKPPAVTPVRFERSDSIPVAKRVPEAAPVRMPVRTVTADGPAPSAPRPSESFASSLGAFVFAIVFFVVVRILFPVAGTIIALAGGVALLVARMNHGNRLDLAWDNSTIHHYGLSALVGGIVMVAVSYPFKRNR